MRTESKMVDERNVYREMDRRGWTEKQTDKPRDRQVDKQTDRQTDRQSTQLLMCITVQLYIGLVSVEL